MSYTPDRLEEAIQRASELAVELAELDGEARRLEKLEKIIFSELVNQSNQSSVAKAEHWARDHDRYRAHVTGMVEARTKANVKKAEWDATQMRFEAWRTAQATRRAEMNLR